MNEHHWMHLLAWWRWRFYRCKKCWCYAWIRRDVALASTRQLGPHDCPVADVPTGTDLLS